MQRKEKIVEKMYPLCYSFERIKRAGALSCYPDLAFSGKHVPLLGNLPVSHR